MREVRRPCFFEGTGGSVCPPFFFLVPSHLCCRHRSLLFRSPALNGAWRHHHDASHHSLTPRYCTACAANVPVGGLSRHATSCHATLRCTAPCHAAPHRAMPRLATPRHTTPHHATTPHRHDRTPHFPGQTSDSVKYLTSCTRIMMPTIVGGARIVTKNELTKLLRLRQPAYGKTVRSR